MSHFDYEASKHAALQDYPFHALIMAAMRQADTDNLEILKAGFPGTWTELDARYNAPGGLLPGDDGYDAMVGAVRAFQEKLTNGGGE